MFAVSGVAAALAISGCQGEKDNASAGEADAKPPAGGPAQTPAPSGPASGQPTKPSSEAHPPDSGAESADLTVSFKKADSSAAQTWTLKCGPAGGDLPDAKAACATLAKVDKPFEPAPKGPCTMIFGGPETATITGTWKGEKVDAKFTRKNGCELDRWTKLKDVLPEVPKVR